VHTNGKTIITKHSFGECLALLGLELVFGNQHVLDKVERHRRCDDVKVAQMHVGLAAELRRKHLHQHLEVIRSFGKVFAQVVRDLVEVPIWCACSSV
jgi:hypothetical protein